MNVLKSMFGSCSSSGEKSEIHETIKKVFGNELVMKDNTDVQTQRSKYVNHVKENLKKYLDVKITNTKTKGSKKQQILVPEIPETTDDRPGRIGPKIVVFDATTGTGRLLLVGDERVSVQGLSGFATIRATACVYSGKWMYEMQLGSKGIMQIGWCTSSCIFSMDTGVGDTSHSYAYDGARVRRWNVITAPYGQEWTSGDVIGSCINLDKGTLEFYRNGESLGLAFDKISRGSGLAYFPAVSLALQEHVYANFGHVPFVFPVEGYAALQKSPTRECARASLLFKSLNVLLDEFTVSTTLKPPSVKNSKIKAESPRNEEEVALKIHSAHSMQSSKPSTHTIADDLDRMSRKAFIMSLTRLVVLELGTVLRLSYVVIAELLPRFKAFLGLTVPGFHPDPLAKELYGKSVETGYLNLAEKLLAQPQARLCCLLDLMWTFLDEAALCDILEHCVLRECLLFDLVSKDMKFSRQINGLYTLCGLMQHRETRHRLVKHIFFNKMTFDNFLIIKRPDEEVLRSFVRKPWWKKPTPVLGETDPKCNEEDEKRNHSVGTSTTNNNETLDNKDPNPSDAEIEKQYNEDCDKITEAVAPLEQLQLEFVLMLLDNTDGTNMVPSTRKIFMEKFKRYILDNCILDLRLFNITRNTSAISWCCHARLLSAVFKLWQENPLGNLETPVHIPTNSYIDGELDYYNVDRLGGVLPYLVRTLRQDLINVLGEDNAFIQSFEPNYNRSGGIDIGIDTTNVSPGLATLPQVISSITRFMQAALPLMPNRNPEGTGFSMKGTRSLMPGSGCIDTKIAYLKLLDGLLALYHGGATKYAEKLCEIRDNQVDLADCLHEIDSRIVTVTRQFNESGADLDRNTNEKRNLVRGILEELERSKKVYEEKLEKNALQMAWVIGAMWTKKRQQELARHFSGALHSLRLASDDDYVTEVMVKELYIQQQNYACAPSKEVLQEKTSILEDISYASLQLEYSSSSNQSPSTPLSGVVPVESNSQSEVANQQTYAASLFAFVPEYHVDAMLELCNTLRLYMHPTVPTHQIPVGCLDNGPLYLGVENQPGKSVLPYGYRDLFRTENAKSLLEWDELMVSCASFLCGEFADSRIVLASTRESLVQTLASFATQPATMRAIERVPIKQQMSMVQELLKPYQNRAWAQSNWVLVRFWHGAGFGYHHRQWPHLATKYGDREPTVNNLGAKVDAGLMSQCFGPCPSEVIQSRVKEYLLAHPKEAGAFLNSLLNQLNWAFSEFITMMQEMDRVANTPLESRQIKLCATCFDLYHGLARALEMTLHLIPTILTNPELCDKQNDLLLGRTCQMLMAVISRTCVRASGGTGFARLMARGLPDMDRVHYYVGLAPVAGCLISMLDPKLSSDHLGKVTKTLMTEPLFRIEGLEFMIGRGNQRVFSFSNYPEDITAEEFRVLELVIDRLRLAKDSTTSQSPGSIAGQSDLLCTICYARPADTAFVPCRHQSCRACIMQHLLQNNQCFFCKSEIESVKDIDVANS